MNRNVLTLSIALAVLASGLWVSYSLAQAVPGAPGHGGAPVAAPQPGHGGPYEGPGLRPGGGGPHGAVGAQAAMPGHTPRPGEGDPMGRFFGLVGQFHMICSNPEMAGLLAVGALKEEIRRKPADVIKDYEALLEKTKSLSLRNAIRLALKDLYKAQGEDEKVLETLRGMVAENDAAIQARPKWPMPKDKDQAPVTKEK